MKNVGSKSVSGVSHLEVGWSASLLIPALGGRDPPEVVVPVQLHQPRPLPLALLGPQPRVLRLVRRVLRNKPTRFTTATSNSAVLMICLPAPWCSGACRCCTRGGSPGAAAGCGTCPPCCCAPSAGGLWLRRCGTEEVNYAS